MKTKNLVQNTANIIRITELTKGDVIKMVCEDYSDFKMYYGIVYDILDNGEKCYVDIIRFKVEKYSKNIALKQILLSGDKDVNIFPAKPEELKEYLNDSVEKVKREIGEAEVELHKKKELLQKVKSIRDGTFAKELKMASYEELNREEYKKLTN